jgi:hypothetical protein
MRTTDSRRQHEVSIHFVYVNVTINSCHLSSISSIQGYTHATNTYVSKIVMNCQLSLSLSLPGVPALQHTYDHSKESTPSGKTPSSTEGDYGTDRPFPSHIQPVQEELASPSRSREDSIMIQNLRRQLRDTEIRLQMSEAKLIEELDASSQKIQTLQRTVDSQEVCLVHISRKHPKNKIICLYSFRPLCMYVYMHVLRPVKSFQNQMHQMSMSYEKDVRLIEQELEKTRHELEEERKYAAGSLDQSDVEHRQSINRSLPSDVQEGMSLPHILLQPVHQSILTCLFYHPNAAQERILDLESRLAALLDSRVSMKSAQSIEVSCSVLKFPCPSLSSLIHTLSFSPSLFSFVISGGEIESCCKES